MVSLHASQKSSTLTSGLRSINLRTDLSPLADLIELSFADSMDSSGRAAIREMRTLSNLGLGLNLLARVNELAQGISTGYVWVQDGRLVGNVSVYQTNWPKDLGKTWIIANVAVHPNYRQRGIATQLMEAALQMIRQQHGAQAVLQVDADNAHALHLYEQLGFVTERTWTTWRRGRGTRSPVILLYDEAEIPPIKPRRSSAWAAEYEMAKRLRPADQGGLGWLRPLHPHLFQPPLQKRLLNWLTLQSMERLVIHNEGKLGASLWIERQLGASNVQLTLMVEPLYQGQYDEALLDAAIHRYGLTENLLIEHPADDEDAALIFRRLRFESRRTLTHMRWVAP
ncbi:MAG: GNAT family N-acetyltransferase [Anaerolineaceae bacterium]|nr:GNAT family N-acetyltransferase [Anaerolineaceae bacterium]